MDTHNSKGAAEQSVEPPAKLLRAKRRQVIRIVNRSLGFYNRCNRRYPGGESTRALVSDLRKLRSTPLRRLFIELEAV